MNINDRVKISVLTKYYGSLLTEKQRQIVAMYVDNNLSLAEVGDELKITRQAVKDGLDKAIDTLQTYEKKLHFFARDAKIKKLLIDKTALTKAEIKKILSILEDN